MDPEKSITGSQKILSSTIVFNIDNKSAYKSEFWRIMWHWRLQ